MQESNHPYGIRRTNSTKLSNQNDNKKYVYNSKNLNCIRAQLQSRDDFLFFFILFLSVENIFVSYTLHNYMHTNTNYDIIFEYVNVSQAKEREFFFFIFSHFDNMCKNVYNRNRSCQLLVQHVILMTDRWSHLINPPLFITIRKIIGY